MSLTYHSVNYSNSIKGKNTFNQLNDNKFKTLSYTTKKKINIGFNCLTKFYLCIIFINVLYPYVNSHLKKKKQIYSEKKCL